MKRMLLVNAIAFPVLFVAMLVFTGTWASVVVPSTKHALVVVGGGKIAGPSVRPSVADSASVANPAAERASIAAARDSLHAERERLVIERRGLETLAAELDDRMRKGDVRDRTAATDAARDRETLARVFQEMEPEEAVDVLQHLDDSSIEYLMKTMQRRRAAEVLAQLDPKQAARLSARILTPRGDDDEKEHQ